MNRNIIFDLELPWTTISDAFSHLPPPKSNLFSIPFWIQLLFQFWSILTSKIHPKSEASRFIWLQRARADWKNTCPEITSKLYQTSVSKMFQSWLQKCASWSRYAVPTWRFARARSSQMDFEASRPQSTRPIRSSPLEPDGL